MPTMNENLTPAQRAANFKAVTRQNLQSMASIRVAEDGHFEFTLPKARFLSKLYLMFTIETTDNPELKDLYEKIKNITVNMNTGFRPYSISGSALFVYNKNYNGGNAYYAKVTANSHQFMVSIPFTLNDTDPVGLILLQNNETVVTVSGEINAACIVTPVLETFTIPSAKEAYPSLSILKLVNSRTEMVVPESENIFRLSTGTIYRKIFLQFFNSDGVPVRLNDTDTIQLVFNQADTPYNLPAIVLEHMNRCKYGNMVHNFGATSDFGEWPQGAYVFDFATSDIPNHNGSRDLIDTERLTEFWVKVNTTSDQIYKCVITTECLTRVQ